MKPYLHVLLACLATIPLSDQASEDYLSAPDRIEWTGRTLYDGVFGDGTRFQIELSYQFPPERGGAAGTWFHPSYWYPKFYQGTPIPLGGSLYAGNPMRLVRSVPAECDLQRDEEFFTINLAPDTAAGHGRWKSQSLNKELDFTLQRAIPYKSVLARRPFRNRTTSAKRQAPRSNIRRCSQSWAMPRPTHGYASKRSAAKTISSASIAFASRGSPIPCCRSMPLSGATTTAPLTVSATSEPATISSRSGT